METLRDAGWVFSGPAQGRLQLLTIAEVCAITSFSRRHVDGLLKAGQFPEARHFGSEVRIPIGDLEAFIARQPRVFAPERRIAA